MEARPRQRREKSKREEGRGVEASKSRKGPTKTRQRARGSLGDTENLLHPIKKE